MHHAIMLVTAATAAACGRRCRGRAAMTAKITLHPRQISRAQARHPRDGILSLALV
jgi:hypothetical protein